jgi:hypothetical protein
LPGLYGLTTTLVKVAVAVALLLLLVTARPTYIIDGRYESVSAPTSVHVLPSVDWYAVKRLPSRTSRTQPGAVPIGPGVEYVVPSVTSLRWKFHPLPAVANMNAFCLARSSRLRRIMTPAFDKGVVF